MKKFLVALFIFLFSLMPLAAQEDNWLRDYDFEEYLFEYEVEVETWIMENPNGMIIINFEDNLSRSEDDVIYQLSYILRILDFYFVEEGMPFEEAEIEMIIYSLFIINNPKIDKYENERFDIYMDWFWLSEYFKSSRKTRTDQVIRIVETEIRFLKEVFPNSRDIPQTKY